MSTHAVETIVTLRSGHVHDPRKRRLALVARSAIGALLATVLLAGCLPFPAPGQGGPGTNFGCTPGCLSGSGADGPGHADNAYVMMIQGQLNLLKRVDYDPPCFCTWPAPWKVLPVNGYYGGNYVSGNFDTYEAVKDFQAWTFGPSHAANGSVDTATWTALFGASNTPTSTATCSVPRTAAHCSGHSTVWPNCSNNPNSNTGSGVPTSFPGIALHNYGGSLPAKGQEGHLFLVLLFLGQGQVAAGILPQIDGMASTVSTVDITPAGYQALGVACPNGGYNVALWELT